MIDTAVITQLVLDAFTGRITWFEAGTRYSLEEFIDTFYRTRAAMQKTLADLDDAQVAFTSPQNPSWSLSETVTHLIYSQNFYYNQLLDITTSDLPHIVEAAKGFGEGAHRDLPAEELRIKLEAATVVVKQAITLTSAASDASRTSMSPFFGKVNYHTWIVLLLAHEIDHVRQAIVMRRLARKKN